MSKLVAVCKKCGSTNVTSDALVSWDIDTQEWSKIEGVLDEEFCNQCEDETTVEYKEIDNAK